VSNGSSVERIGPLPLVEVNSVIGGSDAFWAGLLVSRLENKSWKESVCFAHEIAALKLQQVGHIEKLIDREAVQRQVDQVIKDL